MAVPKEELKRVLRDGLAVLEETYTGSGAPLECPERQRARERCWVALDTGADLGYWEPVPADVRAKAGRR
jgi:hypothetical protein